MLLSLLSIPLLGSFLGVSAAPADNHTFEARQGVNTGFPYGQEKVRGVNLGGWLVLGTSHVSCIRPEPRARLTSDGHCRTFYQTVPL